MDYNKLIDVGSKVSLAVVLMVILFGGVQGYWVSGSTYKEALADRDTWRQLALKGTALAADSGIKTAAGPPTPNNPLPENATAEQVKKKLDDIQGRYGLY